MGACSVDRADMDSAQCTGLSCIVNRTEGAPTALPGALATPDASADVSVRLLKVACGVGSCVPDNPRSCSSYAPPPAAGSGGGGPTDAGAGPVASSDAGNLDAGIDDGGRDPRVDGSFARPTPAEPAPSAFACQLTLTTRNRGIERSCGPSGARGVDEACTSALDCAPGLGCVGTVRSGRCLAYCCGIDGDTCETGSYCAQRPLRSTALGEAQGPMVPVCDRAENCSLGEPANCNGEHCVCAPGTACSVVRPDGTTACVPEGQGEAGEPCPCKWGYHCSQATTPASCVKTCELNILGSCGAGVCQSTPLLPEGWGTCVGAYPEQMP